MEFNEYSKLAWDTAIYPNKGNNITYAALGLAGEAGEVCEKIKKCIRDNNGVFNDEIKFLILKELGDAQWYINAITKELNLSLEDVVQENLNKLYSRRERGTLSGSGDLR